MSKRGKSVVFVLVIFLVLVFAVFSLTGLYIMPPKDAPPSGATLWYYRRSTGLPFLASPDGQKQRIAREGGNPFVLLAPRADRIIARFGFNRSLYLRTTGGIEFLK